MTSLKWAMVGTGFMAELILRDFGIAEGTELYALASRDRSRAEARLAELGVEAKAMTFEEALADAEIDVIYVASPMAQHFEMAKAALAAGKHVLVEKAFTSNEAEARALAELAADKKLFLMEAMWTKFMPMHRWLKNAVAAGELGELITIQANFGYFKEFDASQRHFATELGGGATLDQGVYTTTFNRWLANSKLEKVVSFGRRFANGADSHVDSTYVFENGVIGHGVTSLIAPTGFAARVIGAKKHVEIAGQFWNTNELDVVTYDVDVEVAREHKVFEKRGNGYVYMLEAASKAILAGKLGTDEHPIEFTIETMRILDDIRSQF